MPSSQVSCFFAGFVCNWTKFYNVSIQILFVARYSVLKTADTADTSAAKCIHGLFIVDLISIFSFKINIFRWVMKQELKYVYIYVPRNHHRQFMSLQNTLRLETIHIQCQPKMWAIWRTRYTCNLYNTLLFLAAIVLLNWNL